MDWGDDDPEDGGAWTTEEDDREGERNGDAAAAQEGAAPEAGVEVDAAAIGVRAEDAEAPKIAGAETAETAEMVETAEAEETAEMVETAETAEWWRQKDRGDSRDGPGSGDLELQRSGDGTGRESAELLESAQVETRGGNRRDRGSAT